MNTSTKSEYRAPLKYAEDDAYEVAKTLESSACNFTLLKPALQGREATSSNVRDTIVELIEASGHQDFLCFYFSGHTQPMKARGDGQEDIYLVTYDFTEQQVKRNPTHHLSMRWLWEVLYQRTDVGKILLILDCCYAGNMLATRPDLYQIDLRKLFQDYFEEGDAGRQADRSHFILSATGHDAVAHEQDQYRHGVMTGFLLRALRGEDTSAYDENGHLDISALYTYLLKVMPKEQLPSRSNEGRDRFILAWRQPQPQNGEATETPDRLTDILNRIEGLKNPNYSLPFDHTLCKDASLTDINMEVVTSLFQKARIQKQHGFHSAMTNQGWLEQFNLLQEGLPTYGAVLCFGKSPSKWIAGAFTRCTSWRGKDRLEGWEEDQFFRGSLLEQYESSIEFLQRNLHLRRVISAEGSVEQWEIPPVVLREALANALIHRDYAYQTGVCVEIFDGRIEISSPGSLPDGLTIPQLGRKTQYPPIRNPQIAHVFYLCNYVETYGTGICRMQQEMREAQLPQPQFELSPSRVFKVIIRRPPGQQEAELKKARAKPRLQRKFTKNLGKILLGLMVLLVVAGSGGWWYFSTLQLHPILVTTLNDDGTGSLRQAIRAVQTGSTVTFDPSLRGTILLTSGDLNLNKSITLLSSNLGNISISSVLHGYTISIDPAATVTFENLSFTGSTIRKGAFIHNKGHLTLNNCAITSNISYNTGGGLENLGGSLTLNHTFVSGNAAGDVGGGIYNWNGSLTLNDSIVSGNRATYIGGGIFSRLGSVNIINSMVESNETTSQESNNSAGGGIALLNSLLTLATSTLQSNHTRIQGNHTQGSGGGLILLGSQAIITNSTITGNSAGRSAGGIAVQQDSENDKVSFVIITDLEITDAPQAASFIGKNTAPLNPDILGVLRTDSSRPLIVSVSSDITGSPPPYQFPPEQRPEYRGAVDLDAFCRSKGYQESKFQTTPYNPYVLNCVAPVLADMPFTSLQACQWKVQTSDVMARLADYYDPSSWQCYEHEKKLGDVATPENMNKFCQFLGNKGVIQIGDTAYDWQCDPQSGIPVGLSMANACQWLYQRNDAFDSLVDFNKLSGWECWAPR